WGWRWRHGWSDRRCQGSGRRLDWRITLAADKHCLIDLRLRLCIRFPSGRIFRSVLRILLQLRQWSCRSFLRFVREQIGARGCEIGQFGQLRKVRERGDMIGEHRLLGLYRFTETHRLIAVYGIGEV